MELWMFTIAWCSFWLLLSLTFFAAAWYSGVARMHADDLLDKIREGKRH